MRNLFFMIFLIGGFFFMTSMLSARESSRSGGYMLGQPVERSAFGDTDESPRSKGVDFYSAPETPAVQKEISPDLAYLENQLKIKETVVTNLKKQVESKNKHIQVLEERIARLSQNIKKNEAELFMMRPAPVKRYKVRKGDNLWKIAARKETYGDPYMWITIYNANMDKINDPNLIFAGQLFEIPK
jgi:nucleoid-associated protein YgaU